MITYFVILSPCTNHQKVWLYTSISSYNFIIYIYIFILLQVFHWLWQVYWVGPILGAILATILYHFALDRVGKNKDGTRPNKMQGEYLYFVIVSFTMMINVQDICFIWQVSLSNVKYNCYISMWNIAIYTIIVCCDPVTVDLILCFLSQIMKDYLMPWRTYVVIRTLWA